MMMDDDLDELHWIVVVVALFRDTTVLEEE